MKDLHILHVSSKKKFIAIISAAFIFNHKTTTGFSTTYNTGQPRRSSNTLATLCKEPTHWKRPWCWERLRQEEKGTTEDEMVGWHHRLSGHEFSKLQETMKDREAWLQSMGAQRVKHAAAKSLQSCPTLCDPLDGRPPGSPIPAVLEARTLEWVAISFSNAWKWKVKVKSLSRVRPSTTPFDPQPSRLLHPWDFPGKSTGVGCHCLLRVKHDLATELTWKGSSGLASWLG